jgi:hypothetical protein
MYLMNGASIATSAGVNTVSNLDWKIVGSGDFDGDGKADILLRNSATGQNWVYLMDGASIVTSAGVNTVSNLDWKIVADGDYEAHMVLLDDLGQEWDFQTSVEVLGFQDRTRVPIRVEISGTADDPAGGSGR